MLMREDGLQIPVCLLPNGTGNDTALAFEMRTLDQAISTLLKGELISYDVCKMLFDYETEEELREAAA